MSDLALPVTVIEKRWLQRVTLSIAPAPLPRGAVLMVGGMALPWTPVGQSGAVFTLPEDLVARGDTTAEFVGTDGAKLSAPCPLPIRLWISFGTLVGFIDHVERLRDQVLVKGWAVDWRTPRQRVQIGLEIGGRVMALARADIYHAHLKQIGVGDGHQGFAFCILGNALQDDEEVVLRLIENGLPLNGSPVRLGGGYDKTGGATVVGRLHAQSAAQSAAAPDDAAADRGELPPDLIPVELPTAEVGQDAALWSLLTQAVQNHPQAYLLLRESGTTLPSAQAARLAATLRGNACAGFATAVSVMPDGVVIGGGYRTIGDGLSVLRPPPELDLLVAEIGIPGVVAFHAPVLRAALEDCGTWPEGRPGSIWPGSIWSELAAVLLARGQIGLVDAAVRAEAPYRHPGDRHLPAVSPAFKAAFRPVRPRRRPQRLVELSADAGLGLAWQTLAEILLRRAVVWAVLDCRPVVVLDAAAPAALFRRLRGHGLEVLEAPLPDGLDAAEQPLRHRLQVQHISAPGRGLVLQDVMLAEETAGAEGISLRTHPLALLPPPDAGLTAAMLRAQMVPIAPARDPALWGQRGSAGEGPLDRMVAAQLALESGAEETQAEEAAALRVERSPQACAERLRAVLRDLGY